MEGSHYREVLEEAKGEGIPKLGRSSSWRGVPDRSCQGRDHPVGKGGGNLQPTLQSPAGQPIGWSHPGSQAQGPGWCLLTQEAGWRRLENGSIGPKENILHGLSPLVICSCKKIHGLHREDTMNFIRCDSTIGDVNSAICPQETYRFSPNSALPILKHTWWGRRRRQTINRNTSAAYSSFITGDEATWHYDPAPPSSNTVSLFLPLCLCLSWVTGFSDAWCWPKPSFLNDWGPWLYCRFTWMRRVGKKYQEALPRNPLSKLPILLHPLCSDDLVFS